MPNQVKKLMLLLNLSFILVIPTIGVFIYESLYKNGFPYISLLMMAAVFLLMGAIAQKIEKLIYKDDTVINEKFVKIRKVQNIIFYIILIGRIFLPENLKNIGNIAMFTYFVLSGILSLYLTNKEVKSVLKQ